MNQTVIRYTYNCFGFNVLSEIKLPELSGDKKPNDQVDLQIEKGDLIQLWNNLATPGEFFVIKENFILFSVPETAIFLVEKGKKIVVSAKERSDEGLIRLFILGTCMGAILMQRKSLPLHGSAIAINGKAYAFIGNSGVGKSTLASAFINKGYQILSDDVIAVTFNSESIPYVTPSYPQQKLWQESLIKFGMEKENFHPLYGRESKYSIPVLLNFTNEKLPLAGIFELTVGKEEESKLIPIRGLERIHKIYCHTYRNFFLQPLGLLDWHVNMSTKLVNQLSLYQIKRHSSIFTAPELVSLILDTINEE